MSFDISRIDRSYFDVDMSIVPCSAMVINAEIYNLVAGNVAGSVEYFADVKFGDSLLAMPYVDEIGIEREMGQLAGTLHVGFMTRTSPVSGLAQGGLITVEAGMRFNGKTASQKIFHGRVKKITYPSSGDSVRAYLDGFDAGKDMIDALPGVGYNTGANAANLPPAIEGDIFDWVRGRLETLPLSGVILRQRSGAISVPAGTILAYQSLGEAVKAMANAYNFRYVYMTGSNELVILDPSALASETPLFVLTSSGIEKQQQVDSLLDRVNRIPYQKSGNTAAASIFWVDGSGVMHQTSAAATDQITGTYNDLTDQASFPVLTADYLRNDIVTTAAEFETIAAQMADETQRARKDLTIRFNPFIDLGDVVQIDSSKYFVYRIRHDIGISGNKTRVEVRAL